MAKECNSTTCDKESCAGCSHSTLKPQKNEIPKEALNGQSSIKKVIGVVSGKGGVGKSLVTASLANAMAEAGMRVGILDADITGPSIPRMYGLKGPALASDAGIQPMITDNLIKVMSVNLILQSEETPVIWRGPVIANVVKQFWTDVIWGDLDYLFVDMPPGTGDVPLTVFQSLPVDGIVIVTSPQELVQMIVKKAYNMAEMMHVPVLGIVENYSYIECPDCGRKISVFGESHIDEIAASMEIPVMGKLPLDPKIASAVDAGEFAQVQITQLEDAKSYIPKA